MNLMNFNIYGEGDLNDNSGNEKESEDPEWVKALVKECGPDASEEDLRDIFEEFLRRRRAKTEETEEGQKSDSGADLIRRFFSDEGIDFGWHEPKSEEHIFKFSYRED